MGIRSRLPLRSPTRISDTATIQTASPNWSRAAGDEAVKGVTGSSARAPGSTATCSVLVPGGTEAMERLSAESNELAGGIRGGLVAEKRQATVGCLFSGMGGFASGLAKAGFTIRWASDNDEHACATFRYRFPGVPLVEKDVCDLSVKLDSLTPVDLLAAGFPCQSFSQAGGRKGFEDRRGALFFQIPRLIEEYASEEQPSLVILENVPHLFYGAEGIWFDEVRRSLRRAGYWFREDSCWTVNVKDATDLPQDRERLFMVAASRSHFTYNPFSPPPSASRLGPDLRHLDEFVDRTQRGADDAYLPPDNRYYKMIETAMRQGDSNGNIYQLRRSYVREKQHGLCPTLTANMGVGGHNVPFIRDAWGIRRLSVDEVARFQGFDSGQDLFPSIPMAEQYRLLGNSVCVGLAQLLGKMCKTILTGEAVSHE